MNLNQLIILAGGKGSRLKGETKNLPKPLVNLFDEVSILDILLRKNIDKFKKILIFAGYKAHLINKHISENYFQHHNKIKVLIENNPMGTGGGFLIHKEELEEIFVVINGDTWFDYDLGSLSMLNSDSLVQVLTKHSNDFSRFGSIAINENNLIKNFVEKKHILGEHTILINSGCYLMKKNITKYIKSYPCSLETHIFPKLAKSNLIEASIGNGSFIDIGVPESLDFARNNKDFFKL
jgi:D-glycero-D-manno-heptose 1,7-bisphosphate phosphatase